jgi:hypothetical protein
MRLLESMINRLSNLEDLFLGYLNFFGISLIIILLVEDLLYSFNKYQNFKDYYSLR